MDAGPLILPLLSNAIMPTSDNLSNILGWISIACWIVVYSPQVYENYSLQSGDGLSALFVIIWLLGDLANLVGAILANLLPTVVILAVYYTTCDLILLCQIYYYRWKRARQLAEGSANPNEHAPLLQQNGQQQQQHADEIVPARIVVLRYASALSFVVAVGVAAWWITKDSSDGDESHFGNPAQGDDATFWVVQTLGWSSALLFLGARVPQILKNFKTRCEGLSPALFFFAIFGNTTYALSICAKSMQREYLIKNGGWLAGSLLTVFLDIFVLCQFSYYRYMDELQAQQTGEVE